VCGQKAAQSQSVALMLGKGSTFVEKRITQ